MLCSRWYLQLGYIQSLSLVKPVLHSFKSSVLPTDNVGCAVVQNGSLPSLGNKRPLQWIAELTNGYSGADLFELAAEAAQNSVESNAPCLR